MSMYRNRGNARTSGKGEGYIVKVKRLNPAARIPRYKHPGEDSGADVCAVANHTLQPLERKAIPTGLCVEVPPGLELQIRPRSGLALRKGITVLNTPGTIDSGYRGEIEVILINLGSEVYVIKKGQQIAQLVVSPVSSAKFREAKRLSISQRGARGFGSTDIETMG